MKEIDTDTKIEVRHNRDQLPLYGLVYDHDMNEYEFTLGGVAIDFAARPNWEEKEEQVVV